jgi:hypothetical protein
MSKRSRRLGKKNELREVEEAIGKSLGKKVGASAMQSAREKGMSGKPPSRRSKREQN